MFIQTGDICHIKIKGKNGEKITKGLLIEKNDTTQLWLLVVYTNPENYSPEFASFPMIIKGQGHRDLGYSSLNGGNLIYLQNAEVIDKLGFVPEKILTHICCDIFDSKVSWKLEQIRRQKSTGINFWINFNPYVGVHYPGMIKR